MPVLTRTVPAFVRIRPTVQRFAPDALFFGRPMSDANLLQTLIQVANRHAVRTDHFAQMQLLRFWEEELAKPRNADSKRLLRHGFKMCIRNAMMTESSRRSSGGSELATGASSNSASVC
jgi:hypothetical protein